MTYRARTPRLIAGRRYKAGDVVDASGWPDGLVGVLLRQRIIEETSEVSAPDLSKMTKPGLLALARFEGLEIRDGVTVKELRDLLKGNT